MSGPFVTKAERSFDDRFEKAMSDHDFVEVERLFNLFGSHLELVGEDRPVGKSRVFQFRPIRAMMEPVADPDPWESARVRLLALGRFMEAMALARLDVKQGNYILIP